MITQAYLNIVLQTFGGLISLMIIVFVKFVRREQSESDRQYSRFLICNTVLLFSNVLSWYFDGKSGELNRSIIVVVNLGMYLLHYLLLGAVTNYLLAFLNEYGINCKKYARILWGITIVGGLLVILSQFNGMYYFIDRQNTYQRGELFLLFPIVGILVAVLNLGLLVSQCRKLHSKEYCTFILLLVLAILALIVQAVFYGAVYLYITTTFVAISIYVFIQAEQAHRLSEQALELERGRTAVMLSQIQPHFLYNALTGIKTLCGSDPERAEDAMEHFSYFLRSNLDSLSDTHLIPFDKEISHVKDYFYLEKMRFKDRVRLVLELEFLDFFLPPLTLQPLVENAVRYGITQKDEGGTITIKSRMQDNQVLITITDDGVGFDVDAPQEDGRSHTGIENVRSRLTLQCGGKLEIKSKPGVGTEVRITLLGKEVLL